MKVARQVYMGLAYLFLAGVVIQVYLAGIGIFGNFDSELEPHRAFGFFVMHLIPLLMFIAAIVGRMRWAFIGLTVLLFFTVFFQSLWLDPEDDDVSRWVNAVHPTMAMVMFALDFTLAQRARLLIRGEATWGAQPAV